MPTFLYSPGVQVFIQTSTTDKTGANAEGPIYDVTEDLVSGTLTRMTNGVSTFEFVLQNSGRKYDYDSVNGVPRPLFSPNDKIIVNMKRLKWVRVFTGYLDSVPVFQAWPSDVAITASCTLKRLQYFYWDPDSPASQKLINYALQNSGTQSEDAGLKNLALAILTQAANWDLNTIHIAKIPDDWFRFATQAFLTLLGELKVDNQAADAVRAALGSAATINGGSVSTSPTGAASGVATGLIKGGQFGGMAWTDAQVGIAEIIYNVGVQKGASTHDIIMATMCGMGESSLTNLDHGDLVGPSSRGVFQQMFPGWGTLAQVTDPTYAAGAFYNKLLAIPVATRNSQLETLTIHSVQNNSDPNFYQPFLGSATALVAAIQKAITAKGGQATKLSNQQKAAASTGIASQDNFLSFATGLVENKSSTVTFKELAAPALAVLTDPNPTTLNAAGFVAWAFTQATGNVTTAIPLTPTGLANYCHNQSAKKLNSTDGLGTIGAVMFVGKDESSANNVEISLGNGHQTIAMTKSGLKTHEVTPSAFNFAYLLPKISYTAVATGTGATLASDAAGNTTISTNNDWAPKLIPNPYQIKTDVSSTSKDPLDQELLNYQWVPQDNADSVAISISLTGKRALLNDTPLMPYITNVLASAQRSYCSAPNGDLIAWFPDYFGWYGTAAIMHVKSIELQNFSMTWDDSKLVTHYFTAGSTASDFNLQSGDVAVEVPNPTVNTVGIASVDDPTIMSLMFGANINSDQVKKFGTEFLAKFGARPVFEQLVGINGPKGEFFLALYRFMLSWTYQFNADIPLTFMPEIWPGMLIQLDDFGFQAYVTTVTHTFQFGQGGGFTTRVNVCAPSVIGQHTPLSFISGLPVAGIRPIIKPSDFIPSAPVKRTEQRE